MEDVLVEQSEVIELTDCCGPAVQSQRLLGSVISYVQGSCTTLLEWHPYRLLHQVL